MRGPASPSTPPAWCRRRWSRRSSIGWTSRDVRAAERKRPAVSTRVEVAIVNDPTDRSYPIIVDGEPDAEERFATELCARLPTGKIGIVTDETVAKLHLPRYADALRGRNRRVTAAVVPDGEGSKSLARAEELCE